MKDFIQHQKRVPCFVALWGCMFFLGFALDSKFTQFFVEATFAEWAPAFWICALMGGLGAIGCAAALVRPPLVLAADGRGLTVGTGFTWSFGQRGVLVPWNQVESIAISEVAYWRDQHEVVQAALRIVCDRSIDLSRADDLLGIQTGTAAYFAAKSQQRRKRSVKWKEPGGLQSPEHIVLIGERYFSENVHRVCNRLQKLAATNPKQHLHDPSVQSRG